MRTKQELDIIKGFIDSAYNRFGNLLKVNTDKKLDLQNPEFGYCYKDTILDHGQEKYFYNIVCAKMGIPRSDFRIMMHEYGHIYLGHLDGIHEFLDTQICNVFRDHRGELIERINKECGIDFADKLIERVIDDPVLNHSLHNIAMDMEVNSKVLSTEDVEEMESDITKVLTEYQKEKLEKMKVGASEEQKKQIDDAINRMKNEAVIKLIVPCRYYTAPNVPFEDELSYPEYLMLIIEHLDQFVKMLVSIKNGGNGDTSQVTAEDVQKALEDMKNGGSGSGMDSLDGLMQQMGMSDGGGNPSQQPGSGNGQDGVPNSIGQHDPMTGGKGSAQAQDSPYQGVREDPTLNGDQDKPGGSHKDHSSPSRKEADEKRDLGEIQSGAGLGCGSSGGPGGTRLVKDTDKVDEAIDEVIDNLKSKVVKREMRKDVMWNYNRGINRKVIAPSIKSKVTMSTEPKLVFLIDISGSMDTCLINRILTTISKKMRHLGTGRGLKYDIISWSTCLGEHIKDIDPRKPITRISCGGGTRMARGMEYFRMHYDPTATLILISDFEDYLEEWHQQELKMPEYTMYGFNYGYSNFNQEFKYFKVKNFNNDRYGRSW